MEVLFLKKDWEFLDRAIERQTESLVAEIEELENMGNRRCSWHTEQLIRDKEMLEVSDKLLKITRTMLNVPFDELKSFVVIIRNNF